MKKVASQLLSRGAGLSGFNLAALKSLFLTHGQASYCLRIVFAVFIEWMTNVFPPWEAYRGLLVCYELTLGKVLIGICPIGIDNVF